MNKNEESILYQKELMLIKKALTMMNDNNIMEIRGFLNSTNKPTLKLQQIRTGILKIEDRLNELLQILNTNDDNKKNTYIKQLTFLLKEEEDSRIEEQTNSYKTIKKRESDMYEEMYKDDPDYLKYLQDIEEMYSNMSEEERKAYDENEQACNESYEDFEKSLHDEYYKYAIATGKNPEDIYEFNKFTNKRLELKVTSDVNKNSKKDYTRYEILGVKPYFELKKISKRKLPTEVFKYLISNNIIKEEDFKKYSKNQFGRTFEIKMGDILTEEEMPKAENKQRRYNMIDFSDLSKYPKSEYRGKIFVPNDWDKDSINKFIEHIETNYHEYLSIIYPDKQAMLDMMTGNSEGSFNLSNY